jgi:LysM repeat protein/murein endopeptidase
MEPLRPKAGFFRFKPHAILTFAIALLWIQLPASSEAMTIAAGKPYHGRLVNGIPFPDQFRGYRIGSPDRSYTTPEVIGTLLDAVEAVQREYPNTCELFIGDLSASGGGRLCGHKSHQNGRDADIGMYARGNRPLGRFALMDASNLDVAKTWVLMENLLKSGRVQYIFMDRELQKLFHDHALRSGWDKGYLDRIFLDVGSRFDKAVIRHARNHRNHFHVRFYTPWSTLAASVDKHDSRQQAVIELAQQAYLPKRVHYYANGSETGLPSLARSFGVSLKDLCRWNGLKENDVITPGTCLAFYKRGFELEPVHLAQTLQPPLNPAERPVQVASVNLRQLVASHPNSGASPGKPQRATNKARPFTVHKVAPGDSLWAIARKHRVSLKALCAANGIQSRETLKAGSTLKIPSSQSRSEPSKAVASSVTVRPGDNLWALARRHETTVERICRLNGIDRSATLKPGMRLRLP